MLIPLPCNMTNIASAGLVYHAQSLPGSWRSWTRKPALLVRMALPIHSSTVRVRVAVRLLTLFLSMALANLVHATSFINVQANKPQVSGDATSDSTARFPTNKQNEPTIAVNPTNSNLLLLAGANDEQREPPCGPGPVRGL